MDDFHAPAAPDPVVSQLRAAGCVFAEEEARLLREAAGSAGHLLASLVARRCSGEPLEIVRGSVNFCGVRVGVQPGVFVPRDRSRLLVDVCADVVRTGDVVLDLCCGAGAIGMAVAMRVEIDLHATDLDPLAVATARRNVGASAAVYCGDLYSPLPDHLRAAFDVIVASPPYVPTADVDMLPREALFEPISALDGGDDGLALHRRIAADARQWLVPGGHVVLEVARHQIAAGRRALRTAGLRTSSITDFGLDAAAVVGRLGRRPLEYRGGGGGPSRVL